MEQRTMSGRKLCKHLDIGLIRRIKAGIKPEPKTSSRNAEPRPASSYRGRQHNLRRFRRKMELTERRAVP